MKATLVKVLGPEGDAEGEGLDVADGDADIAGVDGEPTGVVVTLTGDRGDGVTLGLENETSSRGLILLPIPLPIPPFDGGSSTPPGPNSPVDPPKPGDPSSPTKPEKPRDPSSPQKPTKPTKPSQADGASTHDGAPGKPAPAKPTKPGKSSALAVTGTNAALLGGAALALIAGGAWLTLRHRREISDEQ